MTYDPNSEPCLYCGREQDECICHLAPDFPDDPIEELDTDYLDWDYYEENTDEVSRTENSGLPYEDTIDD